MPETATLPAVAAMGAGAWRAHPRWFAVLLAFLVASVPLVAVHAVPLTAEVVIFGLLVGYTALGRRAEFAWAWTPWLAAIVALDDLRGLQAVGPAPHASDVIAAERWLFHGGMPVIDLQHHWEAGSGSLSVHDVVLSLVYLMHSPAPLLCGAALWTWRRSFFRPYVTSILTAATAGLLTYLAFPESPPWLVAQHGLLPPVHRIASEVMSHAGPLAGVYSGADPLPNAAMPSLHFAYPCIVAFWTVAAFGRRVAWIVLYPASLTVGVVYLGEHWVLDVIAGLVYAVGAIAWARRRQRLRAAAPSLH